SFSTYGPPGSSVIQIANPGVDDRRGSFSWNVNANSDNGAQLTTTRYRINDGSWQDANGLSGSTSVNGDWSETHEIDVQVRNEHGDWSGSASESATAEDEPPPPEPDTVVSISHGSSVTCSGTGGSCWHIQVNFEGLPPSSNGYDISYSTTGAGSACGSLSRP